MYREREAALHKEFKTSRIRVQNLEREIHKLKGEQALALQSQAEELQAAQYHIAEMTKKLSTLTENNKFILQAEMAEYTKTFEKDCRSHYQGQLDNLQRQLVCDPYSWPSAALMNCISGSKGDRPAPDHGTC